MQLCKNGCKYDDNNKNLKVVARYKYATRKIVYKLEIYAHI